MNREVDLLGRSMDAAPSDWLDRLVAERVVAQVRREIECKLASSQAHVPAGPSRARTPLTIRVRAWLSKVVPPSVALLRSGGGQRG